jgi:3-deoxy-D-manno-octulosonic-acid transferase
MRHIYSLAWWLALPLVLARLWIRGRKEPGYRQHWGERLGFYRRGDLVPTIWVHAVSVGETRAAEPLVDALLQEHPGARILLTHMTPTGRATGAQLFGKHGARVRQSYLPYDTAWMVARFIRAYRPQLCILMETEVWPNLVHVCARMEVPVALVNARLSERSLRRGRKFGGLMMAAARAIPLVTAQTEADADRIRQLGAPLVHVTGSIKFDVQVPQQMLERGAWMRSLLGARPVLLCASTREGEEAPILHAYAALPKAARPLLLLVPRHPQRFDEVAALVQQQQLALARRSTLQQAVECDVLLGDSMGEMFAYYAACDLAFVGGSIAPLGGQNLIEPAAVGKPVLIGEHTFNFALVTEEAVAAGAACRVADAADLMGKATALLANDAARKRMGEQALAFADHHRGATARTMQFLRRLSKN